MQPTYTELRITPSCSLELFSDLVFSLGQEAVEFENETLIVRSEESLEMLRFGLEAFAKRLSESLGKKVSVKFEACEKTNEDWISQYRASIQPVEAGGVYVHPSWDPPKEGFLNVCIDPALAFGSGHHQSTFGCLQALQKYLPKNATLLDVGCGSGILGITAAKLGAKVEVCDTDELAVQSALTNAALNGVMYRRHWVGSVNEAKERYDVVVANIIADVLIMLSRELIDALSPRGTLVLSGILEKYAKRVETRFGELECVEIFTQDEWCTMIFNKR
ncbi:50S ribosomal protein L11 methyltransferase [Sulfurospirillum sp. T05]|uniref:Ribosomal protein L11 methyltransferase n=1 Tax=Sulfurospirillum tamanense TaxID=2813362 RepID=A0ABS2WU95_9BACT|nr:50S ribosomal protein L11 methyltransferase [Sulfurospirillum tamanensis]MBN2965158.1 50S ribosomal protein L11 methyltransferase [Sulfurospirillum tamanensis]